MSCRHVATGERCECDESQAPGGGGHDQGLLPRHPHCPGGQRDQPTPPLL